MKLKKLLVENQNKVLPQSKLGIAINYTISEWDKLIRYIEDGLIPIDNNLVDLYRLLFYIKKAMECNSSICNRKKELAIL